MFPGRPSNEWLSLSTSAKRARTHRYAPHLHVTRLHTSFNKEIRSPLLYVAPSFSSSSSSFHPHLLQSFILIPSISQLAFAHLPTMASIISNLTNPLITDHPYYPLEVEIASYLANELSVPVLLALFATVCSTVLLAAQFVVNKMHPNLRTVEKASIWWFILCMSLNSSSGRQN